MSSDCQASNEFAAVSDSYTLIKLIRRDESNPAKKDFIYELVNAISRVDSASKMRVFSMERMQKHVSEFGTIGEISIDWRGMDTLATLYCDYFAAYKIAYGLLETDDQKSAFCRIFGKIPQHCKTPTLEEWKVGLKRFDNNFKAFDAFYLNESSSPQPVVFIVDSVAISAEIAFYKREEARLLQIGLENAEEAEETAKRAYEACKKASAAAKKQYDDAVFIADDAAQVAFNCRERVADCDGIIAFTPRTFYAAARDVLWRIPQRQLQKANDIIMSFRYIEDVNELNKLAADLGKQLNELAQ